MPTVAVGRVGLVAGTALALSLLAGCSTTETKAHREADQHADVAATVMGRSLDPIPTSWAAFEVVGTKANTTIEALRADGTVYDGTIVLRITVDESSEFDGGPVGRCYKYVYRNHNAPDRAQHLGSCPPGPALQLAEPTTQADLSTDGVAQLAAVLTALSPAQRLDRDVLTSAVRSVFGAPEVVDAGPTSATQSFVSIRSFGAQSVDQYSCIHAIVPATGAPSITTAHGADCVGG